jgi:nucleotide-binding universal stress UspA family protein
MLPIHTIVHATDFSPQSEAAFGVACAMARDYHAKVIVVHARQTPTMAFGEFGALPPAPEDTEEGLRARLANIHPADKTIEVERFLAEGEPAEEILHLANDRHADLIVLGTHGRTGLGRLVMGSVAEKVMRRAKCMVLTVKHPVPEMTPVVASEEALAHA